MPPTKRSKTKSSAEILALETDEGRLKAVYENYEWFREFYDGEVTHNAHMYIGLTVITLIGTALTPLLLLLLDPKTMPMAKFWQAVPSGVGGLAAAINVAFRFRETWTQSYYTLSALDNEYSKFTARTSPDYSISKSVSEIIDNLQAKISSYAMSEVESWRAVMLKVEVPPPALGATAAPELKVTFPSAVSPNSDGWGSITLSKPAPPEGLQIALDSVGKVALNQSTLFIKSGDTKGNFSFKVVGTAVAGEKATIKASANGSTTAGEITIAGPPPTSGKGPS